MIKDTSCRTVNVKFSKNYRTFCGDQILCIMIFFCVTQKFRDEINTKMWSNYFCNGRCQQFCVVDTIFIPISMTVNGHFYYLAFNLTLIRRNVVLVTRVIWPRINVRLNTRIMSTCFSKTQSYFPSRSLVCFSRSIHICLSLASVDLQENAASPLGDSYITLIWVLRYTSSSYGNLFLLLFSLASLWTFAVGGTILPSVKTFLRWDVSLITVLVSMMWHRPTFYSCSN